MFASRFTNKYSNNKGKFADFRAFLGYITILHNYDDDTDTVYRVLKRVGGRWYRGGQNHQVDGDKFICLDPLLVKDSCLVYSFGVADDWTFEDQMDDLGPSFSNIFLV